MTIAQDQAALVSEIASLQSALIVSHVNPDPDALGSTFAFAEALELAGKRVAVLNESGLPEDLAFLSGGRTVHRSVPAGEWDALLVLDCGDAHRVGDSLLPILKDFPLVANIDHHYANSLFGTHNVLCADASSTCEIIFRLLTDLKYALTPSIASALYAGLLGDTGSFRYSSCTSETLRVAAQLLDAGARPEVVAQKLYGSTPLSVVRVQSEALSSVSLLAEGKIAYVLITADMFSRANAEPSQVDGMAEKVRDIAGVEIAAYIRQDGPLWKVSLRSVTEELSVASVAERFGGGGHKQAAAFRYRRSQDELLEALLPELEALLEART